MRSYFITRQGAGADTAGMTAVVEAYLPSTVLLAQAAKIGRRGERELGTLARALDYIVGGEMPQAADILIQRFKAVEYAAISESGWQVAQHLELLPSVEVAATGEDELRAASWYEKDLVRSRQLGGQQHRR